MLTWFQQSAFDRKRCHYNNRICITHLANKWRIYVALKPWLPHILANIFARNSYECRHVISTVTAVEELWTRRSGHRGRNANLDLSTEKRRHSSNVNNTHNGCPTLISGTKMTCWGIHPYHLGCLKQNACEMLCNYLYKMPSSPDIIRPTQHRENLFRPPQWSWQEARRTLSNICL